MRQWEKALQWAIQYLSAYKQSNVIRYNKVAQTAYSMVHKIETQTEIFYLKQTPGDLFLEPTTLAWLHAQGCENIPTVFAENCALHCFLMTSCGDETLRQLFKDGIDFHKLQLGILHYTNIQRLVENKVQVLASLGIPDWGIEKFALLYNQLVHKKELLLEDGLTIDEIERLQQLCPVVIQLCKDLSAYKILETINHCDFHENNMILDQKTGNITIIDWGETVITHPFFSLNGCLWNMTYFHDLKPSDSAYRQLQSQCVSPWLDLYEEKALLKVFNIANQLNGIYAALTYERMYKATADQAKTLQQTHRGSVAGCLKTFLMH